VRRRAEISRYAEGVARRCPGNPPCTLYPVGTHARRGESGSSPEHAPRAAAFSAVLSPQVHAGYSKSFRKHGRSQRKRNLFRTFICAPSANWDLPIHSAIRSGSKTTIDGGMAPAGEAVSLSADLVKEHVPRSMISLSFRSEIPAEL
jgi:hypothetical protein